MLFVCLSLVVVVHVGDHIAAAGDGDGSGDNDGERSE